MNKKLIIPFFASLVLSFQVKAQDFHLTQYDAFPQYLNPALTGNYLGEAADYKFNQVFRSQWRSLVSKPFTTYGLSVDHSYKRFGIGAYLLNNRVGVVKFNTFNLELSGSYSITRPDKSPHLLSVGLQMGFFYKTFNPNTVMFESQYDNNSGSLNPDIGSGENFERISVVKFDANMGIYYKYKEKGKKYAPFAGFSVFHLSKPSESFNIEKSRLPMRFNLNGGSDFVINDQMKLVPTFLYMNEANASEFTLGVLEYWRIKGTYSDVIFGVNYRLKDAAMLQVGYSLNEQHSILTFRMSYDINASYLSSYTGSKGSIEFSLILTSKKDSRLFF